MKELVKLQAATKSCSCFSVKAQDMFFSLFLVTLASFHSPLRGQSAGFDSWYGWIQTSSTNTSPPLAPSISFLPM